MINTATSVLAFLLVALLQNSERRLDQALHRKVDAIGVALAALVDDDREEARRCADELRAALR